MMVSVKMINLKMALTIVLLLVAPFSLIAQHRLSVVAEPPEKRMAGHYGWNAIFHAEDTDDWGVVIQRIDAIYLTGSGTHTSFYEAFVINPNGYSHHVDRFQDGRQNDDGSLAVFAAAIYIPAPGFVPSAKRFPCKEILDYLGIEGFTAHNPATQAGELPSTTDHVDRDVHPSMERGTSNVAYRTLVANWTTGTKTEVAVTHQAIDTKHFAHKRMVTIEPLVAVLGQGPLDRFLANSALEATTW